MTFSLKTIDRAETASPRGPETSYCVERRSDRRIFVWFQLIIAYFLLEQSLWASKLWARNGWALFAGIVVLVFVAVDRPSLARLGLAMPCKGGASSAIGATFVAVVLFLLTVHWVGGQVPADATWPSLRSAWQYLIWALMQEFILQSFFFTRCEELFGTSSAVWVAASLFSAAHLPSPLLTTFTLVGGLLFCEMFRRLRSIYPIGVIHALLGLTIALTMPDSLLHHMRVGIGYLQY
jgi:membrane protease YdiL (CAAX protease family)